MSIIKMVRARRSPSRPAEKRSHRIRPAALLRLPQNLQVQGIHDESEQIHQIHRANAGRRNSQNFRPRSMKTQIKPIFCQHFYPKLPKTILSVLLLSFHCAMKISIRNQSTFSNSIFVLSSMFSVWNQAKWQALLDQA